MDALVLTASAGAGSVEADDLSFDVVDATVVPTDGGLRPHCQTVIPSGSL